MKSREMQRRILIQELNSLGVYQTAENVSLEKLSYSTLRGLLAIKRAGMY